MYLFIDTETTGFIRKADLLSPIQPRCVQLAAHLATEDGQIVHSLAAIIRPEGFVIPQNVAEIHGITQEIALAVGINRRKVFANFGEMVRLAKMCVAHNFYYDNGILEIESAHIEAEGGSDEFVWRPLSVFCTMKETKDYVGATGIDGRRKAPNLDDLYNKLFGRPVRNAHTATGDVDALVECFFELRRQNIIKI